MAAISGCEIDNLLIEVSGAEVPIMDGSSAPFVFLIDCAGIVEQDASRKAIRIKKSVSVEHNGSTATISPSDSFSISMGIEFDNPVIGKQDLYLEVSGNTFKNDIARARTFGFLHEVEAMRAAGLARGGSLDNAIVVSGDRILNNDGLRFEDEFVRHKTLDCIGDMALAGATIIGHIRGFKAGHALNNQLLRALFADKNAWELVDVDAITALPELAYAV
jgi:UDP-3-O-[3-hydroxymyristoyl] N-acetylglucosamine deacetylase